MQHQDYKQVLNERKKNSKYSTFNTPAFIIVVLFFIALVAFGYFILNITSSYNTYNPDSFETLP